MMLEHPDITRAIAEGDEGPEITCCECGKVTAGAMFVLNDKPYCDICFPAIAKQKLAEIDSEKLADILLEWLDDDQLAVALGAEII